MKRNQKEFLDRLVPQMERTGIDALLLTSPDSVFYATGFATAIPYQTGRLGLSTAVVTKDGKAYVFCTEFEKQNAALSVDSEYVEIHTYPTWVYIEDYTKPGEKKEVVNNPLKTYEMAVDVIPNKDSAVIGVEPNYLPYKPYAYLESVFGADHIKDCAEAMREARVIKTPWEIENLRKAAHYTELAMLEAARAIVPGMTEADVFQIYNQKCWAQSNEVMDVFKAHTVGANFAPACIPRTGRIERGDIIRLDGGVKVNAYNADLARTFAVGGKTNANRERIYDTIYKGFEAGKACLGPGEPMCNAFFEVQRVVAERGIEGYIRGHHGHSLGCSRSPEEAPYLAPGEKRPLEPGMVFCMEVPYYSSRNHSYNIEDTFVITQDGVEFFAVANPDLCL